nr:immunoglobulin heavy chain junction region [Mus musculus]
CTIITTVEYYFDYW